MTGRTQTLPWWLGGEGVKTTENKIYCPRWYHLSNSAPIGGWLCFVLAGLSMYIQVHILSCMSRLDFLSMSGFPATLAWSPANFLKLLTMQMEFSGIRKGDYYMIYALYCSSHIPCFLNFLVSIFPHTARIILTMSPLWLSCRGPFNLAGKWALVLSSRWSEGYTVKILSGSD